MWHTSIRKSLVIFVVATAIVGLVLTPAYLYPDGSNEFDAFWKLALWSIGAGIAAVFLFEMATKHAGEGVAYRNTYWSRILILQIPKSEALELSWQSIKALNLEYRTESPAPGSPEIALQIKRKWDTFQERILIDLSEVPGPATRIDIYCLPIVVKWLPNLQASSLKTQSEKYKKYVEAISRYIEAQVDSEKVLQSSHGERLP